MILFITLSIILLVLAVAFIVPVLAGGTVLLMVCGDLIVFILICWIIAKIIKKIRKK